MSLKSLIEKYGDVYSLMFGFSGTKLRDYHCTLMMLDDTNLGSVDKIVTEYVDKCNSWKNHIFNEDNPENIYTFDKEQFFGENKAIRVLTTDQDIHSELRKKIEKFNISDFKTYQPHVTTNENVFMGKIDGLYLIKCPGYQIVKIWGL